MSDLPPTPPVDTGGVTSPSNSDPSQVSFATGTQKEREVLSRAEGMPLEEVSGDLELTPELEQAGLQRVSETIELPPDVRKLGVQSSGPTQPVAQPQVQPLPQVKLPISDDKVVQGLHAKLISSFRWLAEWCLLKLKKAHLHLVQRNGQVVREREV